jgi:putative membrane protein
MPRQFPDAADKAALLAAVQQVEARTSAEVVVVVRPRSGSYLHADLVVALAFGCATLFFLLFAPWEFEPVEILAGPLAVGALAGMLSSRVPPLRRLLTRASERRQRVLTAARAAFVEKGVGRTRERTGLVVYLSLLERAAAIVADSGIVDRVPPEAWAAATAAIDAELSARLDGPAVAARIAALGDVLAPALPRAADDVNELPDGIEA